MGTLSYKHCCCVWTIDQSLAERGSGREHFSEDVCDWTSMHISLAKKKRYWSMRVLRTLDENREVLGPGSGCCLPILVWTFCRTNYEESMMVRLSVSKREKGLRRRASAMSSQLHSLTHFSDISALTGGTAHLDEVRVRYSGSRSRHVVSHTWVSYSELRQGCCLECSTNLSFYLSTGPESC